MDNSENYIGSANLQTSTAGAEIIPATEFGTLKDFEFLNDQACHISINGRSYIYIRALQGVRLDSVSSFKIQEDAITFNWIGEAL